MSDLGAVHRRRHNGRSQPITSGQLVVLPSTDMTTGVTTDSITEKYRKAARAERTVTAYASDLNAYFAWCDARELAAVPAEPKTVAGYLAWAADLLDAHGNQFYATSTIARWLASINEAHIVAKVAKPGAHPEVAETMAGIRRLRGAQQDKKAPLLLRDLRRTLEEIDVNSWPSGVIGHRDWAILLIGFAGAYRRSELASIMVGDVRIHDEDGLHILLRRSKTDQESRGSVKGVPFGANPVTCAPCAYVRWMRVLVASTGERSELIRILMHASTDRHVCRDLFPELPAALRNEPLFRPVMKNGAIKDRAISGDVVNSVVRRRAAAAGLNFASLGAHSLRAGFVTQAFRAGATHHEIMRQTGHTHVATVEGYSRDNDPLAHNAVTRLGL